MLARLTIWLTVHCLALSQTPAEARRVALVIGQSAYSAGLSALPNPRNDAAKVAQLLAANGFDVLSCDGGVTKGCFDLGETELAAALRRLTTTADGADTALAFFAGHGVATPQGNVLAPVDASLDCSTGAVRRGVVFEHMMQAVAGAKRKLIIVDACRDNPLAAACPGLDQRSLSFSCIEAGALEGFLLVTSTQFGQQALDGPAGSHSPFAAALLGSLASNQNIYFDQVMNEVAKATHETAQRQYGFLQIPGRVVGRAAPADCLSGRDCVGDARMAALALENERLAGDAAGVRNLLVEEERVRGKPYSNEERRARVATLEATLKSIGQSGDPLRQQAKELFAKGDVSGGRAKLDLALDTEETAIIEAERVSAEKRRSAAASARDLAQLARGRDVAKSQAYLERATRLDPSDGGSWQQLGDVARDSGQLAVAKRAYATAESLASAPASARFWAAIGSGDVIAAEGSLAEAAKAYARATDIAKAADPAGNDPTWQRDISAAYERAGDVLQARGALTEAGVAYRDTLRIRSKLAADPTASPSVLRDVSITLNKTGEVMFLLGQNDAALDFYERSAELMRPIAIANPDNPGAQRDYSVSIERTGDVLVVKGRFADALKRFQSADAIRARLAASDPSNATWQRDRSVALNKIGDVQLRIGQHGEAAQSFRDSLRIVAVLTAKDPSNTMWQRDLAVSHERVGDAEVELKQLSAALKSFEVSAAIAERLTRTDPGNTQWRRDHSVFLNKIGDVEVAQGRHEAAVKTYARSLAIITQLAAADTRNAMWKRDLALTHNKAGDAAYAVKAFDRARQSYVASESIAAELAAADAGNATAQVDHAVSLWRVANVKAAEGKRAEAVALYERGRAIVSPLADSSKDPRWRNMVRIFEESIARTKVDKP